jgi:carboxyl-terminal processing protease
MSEGKSQSGINWLLLFVGGLALVCLALTVGASMFYVGRATAVSNPTVETIAEVVEVTRVVEVVREVTVTEEVEVVVTVVATPEGGETAVTQPQANVTPMPSEPPAPTGVDNLDLGIFYETWGLIESDFDGQIPTEQDILNAIISGSLETLNDPYTQYIRPDLAQRMRDSLQGSIEGIGAFVRFNDDGFMEIVRPISGQPAEAAGLRAGDVIIAIDGEQVAGQSSDEILLKVRGPRGTVVNLTVLRGEEELTFTITRVRFEVPIIESAMVTDEIGYLRLTEFNANAERRVLETLRELQAQGAQSLILDLRDNPGGYLDQSIAISDLFLAEGIILFERNNKGEELVFEASAGDEAETLPIVVLVNAASASASEIVAGALQDNGRSLIIGETSFGKGSVQRLHTLSDGSLLRVTINRWYTPNNISISEAGITPDIEVPSPEEFTLGGEGDTQLERAIEYLKTGR